MIISVVLRSLYCQFMVCGAYSMIHLLTYIRAQSTNHDQGEHFQARKNDKCNNGREYVNKNDVENFFIERNTRRVKKLLKMQTN